MSTGTPSAARSFASPLLRANSALAPACPSPPSRAPALSTLASSGDGSVSTSSLAAITITMPASQPRTRAGRAYPSTSVGAIGEYHALCSPFAQNDFDSQSLRSTRRSGSAKASRDARRAARSPSKNAARVAASAAAAAVKNAPARRVVSSSARLRQYASSPSLPRARDERPARMAGATSTTARTRSGPSLPASMVATMPPTECPMRISRRGPLASASSPASASSNASPASAYAPSE
mmetsp:Transcript_174/g.733  ORF Transcript_174/g.733 Transcript_174/m.733 type:complete len:237 (-) Transcript_174:494-1204(-)